MAAEETAAQATAALQMHKQQQEEQEREAAPPSPLGSEEVAAGGGGKGIYTPLGSQAAGGCREGDTCAVSHAARTVTAAGVELRELEQELARRLDRIIALEEAVRVLWCVVLLFDGLLLCGWAFFGGDICNFGNVRMCTHTHSCVPAHLPAFVHLTQSILENFLIKSGRRRQAPPSLRYGRQHLVHTAPHQHQRHQQQPVRVCVCSFFFHYY